MYCIPRFSNQKHLQIHKARAIIVKGNKIYVRINLLILIVSGLDTTLPLHTIEIISVRIERFSIRYNKNNL